MKIVITIDIDGEEVKVSSETVKEETEKEIRSGEGVSDYARFFDAGCVGWTKDAEYNLMFLRQQQRHANDLLKAKGYLFLNDVYEMLDIPRSKAGQVVGWIYDEKNPISDNFVDFGLNLDRNSDFVNGYCSTVLLDFNVNGNILDLI